ncbi:MAG: tRNA pseudouridine(13) synthase TruD [Nanoarchaeota archaeon]|nr:tRNA pseudouridine(13) synthase TruD [Nanoarchaeota archaeon]
MIELDKGRVIFKNKADDFIVEEIGENYVCSISNSLFAFENAKVDLGKLDCDDRRNFLTCDLEKIGLDHFHTFSIVGKKLGKLPHELGYAGTKDKCAWTCQRISIFNPNIRLIKDFSSSGIILKNFRWAKHKIKVGDLEGNRFRVVLRDVDKEAIKILNRVRNTKGFPNFFGMQRFGSLRRDNVRIGKLILQQKFEDAVFAYLVGFGEKESDEVKIAKKKLKSDKNLVEAIKYFPEKLRTEHGVLRYLSSHPKDWIGALKLFDEKSLLMICQSVQSQLFNDILERAIEEGINLNNQKINLIGYNSNFSPGEVGRIEREVLKEHGLEFKSFNTSSLPFLSLKGSSRQAFFEVKDLIVETGEDELFLPSKKIILSFILDSGSYATTLLEQFFILREESTL